MQEVKIYTNTIYYVFGYHKLVRIIGHYKTNKTVRLSVFCESFDEVKIITDTQVISEKQWLETPKVLLRENELRMYEFIECNSILGYQVTEIPYNCKYFKEANNNGKKTT